jgi:hypothetical protein
MDVHAAIIEASERPAAEREGREGSAKDAKGQPGKNH